jgi:polyisoprenoid-binding protein YceI
MQSQTPELPLAPGRWLVDAAHSSVGFTIRHLGVAKVRGRFARFTAGELGIGDITGPLSLTVTFGGIQEVPGGGPRHAGFEARGLLRRSDFGIAPGFPAAVLGEIVTVELDLELLEP